MIQGIKNIWLNRRFFIAGGSIILCFVLAFQWAVMIIPAILFCIALTAFSIADLAMLFSLKKPISGQRYMTELLSLGDDNPIRIEIHCAYSFDTQCIIVDEIPEQFKFRNFKYEHTLKKGKPLTFNYDLKPVERGEYYFGDVNVFVFSPIALFQRRLKISAQTMVKVYPSIIQMKHFELLALSPISKFDGLKKIRRIGHSYEFEQIKTYVPGDDFRSINWKATGRSGTLMVNQYEDEKSQPVYCLIDKSRNMKHPFLGQTLLDYSINSSLVLSNIALQKQDKAGLFTFSSQIESTIPASNKPFQLKKILETLYKEGPARLEADYERLYYTMEQFIPTRSLLFLFTNFETSHALKRMLPILKKIGKKHLLVLIYFIDSEILEYSKLQVNNLEGAYRQVVAEKFLNDKALIAKELQQNGIQTIYTRPEDLNIHTVNKYLEIKARGF